jgi:hypothetical protein
MQQAAQSVRRGGPAGAPTVQADVTEIRRALDLLTAPGAVVEVRGVRVPGGKPHIAAGYFLDRDKAAQAAAALDKRKAGGVYLVLNEINPALLARSPNQLTEHLDPTTSDSDIIHRRWLPLDFDPTRPAGVSATEDEHCAAEDTARSCAAWLSSLGWPAPILADSGNGAHLLHRVDLPADDGGLIQRCIEAVADRFTAPGVDVDRKVFNAARIFKLYGTTARKGHSTADRPHRLARLVEVPELVEVVPAAKLEALAAMAAKPEPSRPARHDGNGAPFTSRLDVPRWLAARGVGFKTKGRTTSDGRTVYILDTCPFDQGHGGGGETSIMQGPDGKLAAACMHNSCSGRGWQEFKTAIGAPGPDHWDPPLNRNGSKAARPAPPLEPGKLVKAKDRDNFGTVVSDNGGSCTVHFVSPEGQAADVELPTSQLCSPDGRPLTEPDGPPRFITTLMTSAELDDLAAEPRYIVKNMVPAGQVGAEGAKTKGCKTGIATDLTISVSSGTRCLNEFDVPERAPVLFLCGESGASKIRRQARHICEARGLALRDLPIFWGFDLPKLCLPFHVDALAGFIRQNKVALAIIDPLYLALFTAATAGRSGDLYTMGATFEPLTALCRETGASILLVHHFRKNRGDDQQEPCSLEELSQAGLAEVARWWILLDRREPYAGDGKHALWLRVGGSEGHASFWSLDIDEGLTVDSEGNQRTTRWETSLGRVQDAKAEEKRAREARKALDLEKREGEHVEKLVQALRKHPAGQTARQLRADAHLNQDNFLRAVAVLQQAGRIEEISIAKQRGTYDGFKLKM